MSKTNQLESVQNIELLLIKATFHCSMSVKCSENMQVPMIYYGKVFILQSDVALKKYLLKTYKIDAKQKIRSIFEHLPELRSQNFYHHWIERVIFGLKKACHE